MPWAGSQKAKSVTHVSGTECHPCRGVAHSIKDLIMAAPKYRPWHAFHLPRTSRNMISTPWERIHRAVPVRLGNAQGAHRVCPGRRSGLVFSLRVKSDDLTPKCYARGRQCGCHVFLL